LESWQNLKDNLKANGVAFEGMPVVIQYNKRDLNDILSVEAMQEALGLSSFPFVEAVASAGRGVTETFKLISKLTFVDLLRRLQGRRPEEASLPTGRESKDDIQSWRQSLFTRMEAKEPKRPRPLAAVPSPSEEAPFDTGEPPAESAAVVEGPFGAARDAAPPPASEATELPEPLEVVDEVEPEAAEPPPEPEPAQGVAASGGRTAPPTAALAPSPETPPPAPAAIPAEALRELETRFEALLETRRLETSERLEQTRADFARVDAACNALASRLEILERQSGESARSLEDARQSLEARLAASEERARSDSQEIARIAELSDRAEAAGAEIEALGQRVAAGLERLDTSQKLIEAGDKRHEVAEKRLRTLEDDVGMALVSLTERVEKLQQQINAAVSRIEALQTSLEEKTNQGRREAEDIRTQLAPLLEAHGQRHAADERMLGEIDRLREGLADSLSDLSEQLRRAVRGI
ncbi:MAG: hypothetical protein ACM3SU_00005, partial [Acidobacteriota bacterium]